MKGVEAKLARANELLASLTREAAAFVASIPPPRIEKGFRPGSSTYAFRAHAAVDVPLRFAILTGEVIHHLRASLDHTVSELVRAAGNEVMRSHQFPICTTAERFTESLTPRCLDGVPARARSLIETLQPYRHSNPEVCELQALQVLDNADKHRLLVVVAATAQVGTAIRIACDEPAAVTGMSPPFLHPMDGSEFFSIDFRQPYASARVDIDTRISLALQKPAELDWPFTYADLIPTLQQLTTVASQVSTACASAG